MSITREASGSKPWEDEEVRLKQIQTIFDTMSYVAWMKDKDGRYIVVNRSFIERYNKKNAVIIGKTNFEIFDGTIAAECKAVDDCVMRSKTPQYVDLYASGRWFDVYVAPLLDENGEVIGTIGTSRKITKRKKLEIELNNQKKFLKTMIDTIPDLVFYKDINSVYLGGNKTFVGSFIGLTEDEIIGKTDLDFFQDHELARFFREKDQEVFRAGVTRVSEEQRAMIDGSSNDFETLKTPFYDERGEVAGLIGISRNISARKRIEKQLKEQKEYAQLLLRIVPSAVFSIDTAGKITSWNERAEMITGYSAVEVIGQACCEFTDDSDRCWLFANDAAAPVINKISSIKTKQGNERKILKSISLIKNECGEITGVIECFDDITERQEAEKKLRASEEKFRQLAENIHEVFIIRDREKILYISPAYEKMMGRSSQCILESNQSVFENVHPDDRERAIASFVKEGEDMEQNINEEFRVVRPDGTILWVWLRSYPIQDKMGSIKQKAVVIADITDRKQMEEQLRRREQQTQQELNLAARIQQEALPQNFAGEKVRINTIFTPYETVGGDLVNYKWFEKQNVLRGYVVDVSGHGVSTALQTATVKMLLDNRLLGGREIVEEDFQHINQRMLQYLSEESFAALLYFEFDFHTKILSVISAGINLFLAAKNHECVLVPVCSCYLGVLDYADIQMVRMPFKAGEIYGMMSDGVSDLIEFHGTSKRQGFSEYTAWLKELCQSPERRDDFSVICIEILPDSKEVRTIHIQNDDELEQAQIVVSEFIALHAPNCAGLLEVAVNEAINNAFRASEQVCIKIRRVGNRLLFRIKDDGPGFSTAKINAQLSKNMQDEEFDAEFDEISLEEGGRGILIMKMFSDRLLYNEKGNEVLLMKKIK